MAPAACDTIWQNLQDFGRSPEDYSRIITGDLGYVGQSILFDLLLEKGYDIRGKHLDCGMTIFDQQTQDTPCGRQRMRVRGNGTFSIYSSQNRTGRMGTCVVCAYRSTHVYGQLQRRCKRAGDCPRDCVGA